MNVLQAPPRVFILRLALLTMFPALMLSVHGETVEAASASPRVLLHARLATFGETCAPALTNCSSANVIGLLENQAGFYYLYILAYCPDPAAGLQEIHTGIDYDARTVSGVDLFRWNLCADSETSSTGWYQEGGDNRIRWDSCPTDTLVVAGYFYVTAYAPSSFALVPPPADTVSVTACGGAPVHVPPTSLGFVGFGGNAGCNPCLDACVYTPVESTTWSGIKNFFRAR